MRLGDLLALRWSCVDFGGRSIRIAQSLWQGQLVSPKTKVSIRTIAFGDVLEQVLTEHLERSTHIGAKDFLFCTPDGETYNPDVLRSG